MIEAQFLHTAGNLPRCKKLVTQIHRDPVIPVFNTDVISTMTLVISGIVHQHGNRTKIRGCFSEAFFQRGDVSDITLLEPWFWKIIFFQAFLKPLSCIQVQINECNPGLLPDKCLNEAFSNP